MSDDRLQPGYPLPLRKRACRSGVSGRVFAKRDFEFWHPATVEYEDDNGVLVVFDNIDEATVGPDDVMPVDLQVDDIVFVQRQEKYLGGYPSQVTKVLREAVEVRYLNPLSQKADRFVELLRDIRWYTVDVEIHWKKGDRVIAYVARQLDPHVDLFYPGTVQAFHFGMCVEVDFDDGTQALVPTTLLQPLTIVAGDRVYVRNDQHAFVIAYEPCTVLEYQDNEIVVRYEGTGDILPVYTSAVGIVPRGYEMRDEKLVKQ